MSQAMEFITDQALLRQEIRAAAADLFFHVDRLRDSLGWPWEIYEERAYEAVQRARAIMDADDDLPVCRLVAAVNPIINEWWPAHLPDLEAARNAVERLRVARATASYAAGQRVQA
jgi:hypothetical protein